MASSNQLFFCQNEDIFPYVKWKKHISSQGNIMEICYLTCYFVLDVIFDIHVWCPVFFLDS